MMKLRVSSLVLCGCVLAASPASAFDVSSRWCSGSPEFKLGSVPKGAASIDLKMLDLQAQGYRHGGGVVAYTGQKTIPCGALNRTYEGPSPPGGQQHTDRWTITAKDASGKTLGETSTERRFPEKK